MPTYTFKRLDTGEIWTEYMSISARDAFVEDKNIEQQVASPAIVSGFTKKPDNGFRDVLKHIKSSHYKSNLNTF